MGKNKYCEEKHLYETDPLYFQISSKGQNNETLNIKNVKKTLA